MAENPLTHEETLDVLKSTLDANAFDLVSGALKSKIESREQEAITEKSYRLMAGMVAGYEYIFIRDGYAHTQTMLETNCVAYLKTPKPDGVPDELDHATRLFAGYFLVTNPYFADDYGLDDGAEFLRSSGIEETELKQLLHNYVRSTYEKVSGEIPDIETCIENELFYGEPWDGYLQNPGLMDKIKDGLFAQGYEKVYDQLKYTEEED